jgi:hypothetical protein
MTTFFYLHHCICKTAHKTERTRSEKKFSLKLDCFISSLNRLYLVYICAEVQRERETDTKLVVHSRRLMRMFIPASRRVFVASTETERKYYSCRELRYRKRQNTGESGWRAKFYIFEYQMRRTAKKSSEFVLIQFFLECFCFIKPKRSNLFPRFGLFLGKQNLRRVLSSWLRSQSYTLEGNESSLQFALRTPLERE